MLFISSLVLTAVLSGATTPSGIELERVIDNASYQPPGMPGRFFIERTFPVICDSSIVFAGITEFSVNSALYAATPDGVAVLANVKTPVPGGAGTFQMAEEPVCGGDRVFFVGDADLSMPGSIGRSLYSWRRGTPTRLELVAPTAFGPIEAYSFGNPHADGEDFVARANLRQSGFQGGSGLVLKRQSQAPELIFQDFTQILPGQTAPADALDGAVLGDGNVYFGARQMSHGGIYRWSPATGFSLLLDNQVFHPEIGGRFELLGVVAAVEEGLLFAAIYSDGEGIFLRRHDGRIETLVRSGDLTTEGQTLRDVGYAQGDASLFAFYGSTVDSPLFVDSAFVRTPDGSLQRILTFGETIEGRPVSALLASANGREVAVLVDHGATFDTTLYRTFFGPPEPVIDVPILSVALAALASVLAIAGLLLLRRF